MEASMAIKTIEERLEEIQTAISGVLASSTASYTIDGNTFTKLDLDKLRRMEDYWLGEYANSIGSKPRVSAAKFGRVFS
jgi:hypothetical protein